MLFWQIELLKALLDNKHVLMLVTESFRAVAAFPSEALIAVTLKILHQECLLIP